MGFKLHSVRAYRDQLAKDNELEQCSITIYCNRIADGHVYSNASSIDLEELLVAGNPMQLLTQAVEEVATSVVGRKISLDNPVSVP